MEDNERRTVYILRDTGWSKLTIPASAKVTFGPLIPGQNPDRYTSGGKNQSGYYLRVYRTKDQQLAVIPGVIEFRDGDVDIEEPTSGGFAKVTEHELLGKTAERRLEPKVTVDELLFKPAQSLLGVPSAPGNPPPNPNYVTTTYLGNNTNPGPGRGSNV